MEQKKKYGWTAWGILGFVFMPMGLIFLPIGLGLWFSKAGHDPEDPLVFLAVFGGIGTIFLLLGLAFLFVDLRRRARMRRAYESGNCVEAKILDVVTQRNVSTTYGQPRMVQAAWTDPNGVVHVYHSRYLNTDVTKLLQSDTVPVYIDRYNENIGFVDIDAVLPEIRIHH